MIRHTCLIALFSLATAPALASTPVGTWAQVDDKSGETRSYIEIYEATDSVLEGKIVKIVDPPEENAVCDACPKDDPRHGQPIEGLVIMTNLKLEKDEKWFGEIMDPENGKTYDTRIWVDDEGSLLVRGYIGFFFRTQTWLPAADF